MRNLKRALSLVLAMVMLLGMMTIPTGAASNFADADQIVNTEEVQITSGMGLFAGSDGNFNPQGTVTRAQMATIIVKMLRGSDFNADAFKGAGVNPFTDTASFEGGWAEGYINACYQMGVVKGYGDGIFKPEKAVSTAEALTMLINALGVDPGEGEWPTTYMAKAEEMKLYGDLATKPGTNDALIRDQLAVLVYEAVCYSPSGATGYRVPNSDIVFTDVVDALYAVNQDVSKLIPVVGEDTLASKIYEMKVAYGYISGNQTTGRETTVLTVIDANGRPTEEFFDVETGLDMVGRYVTVYYKEAYKSPEKPGVFYTIVDDNIVVTLSEAATNYTDYRAAFPRNYEKNTAVTCFDGNYNITGQATLSRYVPGSYAPAGTYYIMDNVIVSYVAKPQVYATYVSYKDETSVLLPGMNNDNPISNVEGDDRLTEYMGMTMGDYVTCIVAQSNFVVSPVDPVKGVVSAMGTNADGDNTLTVNGTAFVSFDDINGLANNHTDLNHTYNSNLMKFGEQYTAYVSMDNQLLGWKAADGSDTGEIDVNDIVYAMGTFKSVTKDQYGEATQKWFLQGVNVEGEEVHYPLSIEYGTVSGITFTRNPAKPVLGTPADGTQIEGFYIVKDVEKTDANAATYTDERKEGIKTFKYIGIKNPTDGTINDTGLYYGTNFWSSTSENGITIPMGENNSHVCNQNCVNESTAAVGHAVMGGGADYHDESEGRTKVRTFYTSATKYLIVDGELGKQLKCEAGGENFSYKIVDGKFMHPMLYRTGETGMPEVVMAVVKKDPDELAASTAPVYVVSANPDSYGDNTVTYKVYSASSAEEMELVMRPENAFDSAGYWTYNFDEDGLAKKGSPCNEIASYGDTCFEGVTFNGLSNSKISVLDSNGNPVTPPTGASVTNTKVVDLRTAAEIASSGVAKITSTAQMDALYKAGKVIYMNVWAGKSSVNTIFIIGSQFDSSTGEQTGGIHDNYTGVVYVANPISANIPTKVYDTQGQEKVITLTQNSTVTGFAKIKVDKGQIILEAVPVTDQRYHVGEAETGVVNNAITTASGLSLNLTAATKYADLTAMNVTDKATFESAVSNFDLVLGVMDDGNGNAAMIVVVGVVDPNVSDGMVIYVARELANNGGAGMVTVDHSGNPNYPIYYSNVILPDGVQKMSGSYYKVEQSNGTTNLSFSHNYAAADGDVYYIQKRGVPGESVKALIIDSTSNAAMKDKWVYLKMPALPDTMTGATRTTSRFWTIQSGLAYRFLGVYNGTASQGGSDVGSYKLSYHDKISAVDGAAMTITRQNAHNSDGSPKTPCSGTPWNHTDSCGSIPNEQRREIVLTAGFSNNTRIINLTDKTIDGTTVTEKLESIKTLSGNGEVIVNLYAADGVQTSATIDVVLVLPIDPADIVIPAVTP